MSVEIEITKLDEKDRVEILEYLDRRGFHCLFDKEKLMLSDPDESAAVINTLNQLRGFYNSLKELVS